MNSDINNNIEETIKEVIEESEVQEVLKKLSPEEMYKIKFRAYKQLIEYMRHCETEHKKCITKGANLEGQLSALTEVSSLDDKKLQAEVNSEPKVK